MIIIKKRMLKFCIFKKKAYICIDINNYNYEKEL